MKKTSKKKLPMKSYKNGGKMKMYEGGGPLGTAGTFLQTAAPFVGAIPGVGMVLSPLASMAGGLMSQEQDKRDLREANALTNKKNFLSQNLENRRGAYGFMEDGGSLIEMEGPKHEQGGIKLPQFQAEVEGGETINQDNMFVNSDHLGYDKDGYPTMNPKAVKTTFADKSKKIEDKYKNKRSYEELMGEKFSQKMVNKANEKVTPPEPVSIPQQPAMGPAMMQGQMDPTAMQPPMGEEMADPMAMPQEGEMAPGQMRMGGSLYKQYEPGGYLPPMPQVSPLQINPLSNQFTQMTTPFTPFSGVTNSFNQSMSNLSQLNNNLSSINPSDNLQTMGFKANTMQTPTLGNGNIPATNIASGLERAQSNLNLSNQNAMNQSMANSALDRQQLASRVDNNITKRAGRAGMGAGIREGIDQSGRFTMGDKMNLIGAGLGMAAQVPSLFTKPEKAIARMTNPQLNYNKYNTTPEMQRSEQAFRNYANQVASSTSNSGTRTARLLAGLANTNQQQSNITRQAANFNNQIEQQNAAAINAARQANAREAARIDEINSSNAAAAGYGRQQAGINMGQQLAQTGQYFNQLDSQKLQLGILNDMYSNYGLSAVDLNNLLKNLEATGQIATYKKQQGK